MLLPIAEASLQWAQCVALMVQTHWLQIVISGWTCASNSSYCARDPRLMFDFTCHA